MADVRMKPEIVDAAARLAFFIHNKGGGDPQHNDLVLILKELRTVMEEREYLKENERARQLGEQKR